MGIDCNVIPQIKVGDSFTDSLLFTQLWNQAKSAYPNDSVKAREVAKSNYAALKSTEFKSAYGDWQLLRAIQNNNLTNAQKAIYRSIYGNNLNRLKESITIELNEQGEPLFEALHKPADVKRAQVLINNELPFIDDSEQAYINRVLSAIAIRLEPQLKKLNNRDAKINNTVKNQIITALRQYANNDNKELGYVGYGVKANERAAQLIKTGAKKKDILEDKLYKMYKSRYDEIMRLCDDMSKDDSKHIWSSFKNFYRAMFGANITEFDNEDSMLSGELNGDGSAVTNDEFLISKSWNNALQYKVNRKNTASMRLKKELTEMIYNNEGNFFITPKGNQLTGSASYYNKYGLMMPLDINVLWNDLIRCCNESTDKVSLLNKIKILSENVYSGQLQPLIDKMKDNDTDTLQDRERKNNYYNMFTKSVDMAMTDVTYTEQSKFNFGEEDFSMAYAVKSANRTSFAVNKFYNIYRNNLTNTFMYAPDKSSLDFYEDAKITKTDNKIADAINLLCVKANFLGIDWSLNTVLSYLSQNNNIELDSISNLYAMSSLGDYAEDNRVYLIEKDIKHLARTLDNIFKLGRGKVTDKTSTKAKNRQIGQIRNLFMMGFNISDNNTAVMKTKDGIEYEDDIEPVVDHMQGYISTIASVGACDPAFKIDLSYINVEGEQEYTPEFYNDITSRLQGIISPQGKVNTELLIERFKDFIESSSTAYNPLIWNLHTKHGFGFFNCIMENGEPILDKDDRRVLDTNNPVNIKAVKEFSFARFNGTVDRDSGKGIPYVDMHDYVWVNDCMIRMMQGRFSLPSADASRIYEFYIGNHLTETRGFNTQLSMKMFKDNGDFVSWEEAMALGLEDSYMYKCAKDTLLSEFQDMRRAMDILFDYDPNTKTLSIKKDFLFSREILQERFDALSSEDRRIYGNTYEEGLEAYIKKHEFDPDTAYGLRSPMFWNGSELIKDGKPTGNIFKLHNLNFRYTNEDGSVEVRDITDYINKAYVSINGGVESDYGPKPEAFTLCRRSADIGFDAIIDRAFLMMFCDRMQNHVRDYFKYLEPVRDHIQATRTYQNQLGRIYKIDPAKSDYSQLPKNNEYKNDKHWAYVLANLDLNHYIASVAIQDIFTGKSYEFNGALDWAKRASQAVRVGATTKDKSTYTQIIVQDVKLRDNMFDILSTDPSKVGKEYKFSNATEEEVYKTMLQRFGGKITTTDAFNIITAQECLKRFKAMGDYLEYDLPSGNNLDDLVEGKQTPTAADYKYIVEQLKYYYYERGKSPLKNKYDGDFIFSHQDKNSTIVIFPGMYKGTMYETLGQWMDQEGIGSINFASGHKVGGVPAVNLFSVSEDGTKATLNIVGDPETGKLILKNYPKGIEEFKHTLKYQHLYQQQQIPSHLIDERNKIGTQLEKHIVDMIQFDGDYNIAGTKFKGKTGKKGSIKDCGAFDYYQMMLSSMAVDERNKLLADWGALDDNGNIKTKSVKIDGGIYNAVEVDITKVLDDLRNYFEINETDRNFLKACVVIDGKPFIPFSHPTIKRRIESVLLAKITKRVTNLKLKGAHVTIQPDTFMRPTSVTIGKKGLMVGTQENINRLIDEGQVKFSDDYWKNRCELDENGEIKRDKEGHPIVKVDADFALKSEYYTDKDGNEVKDITGRNIDELTFHPAEMILNNWDSRFRLDENGYLDLNSIPDELKTMFGIRIPTEGHQSMFVAKVIGVLNNGASQAILPEHLITRTGWDFDIDSIYLSMKDFEVVDGKYVEYSIKNDLTYKQSLEHIADTYFSKKVRELKDWLNNDLKTGDTIRKGKISLINELADIKKEINTALGKNDYNLENLQVELAALKAAMKDATTNEEMAQIDIKIEAVFDKMADASESVLSDAIDNTKLKELYQKKKEIHKALKDLDKEYKEKYYAFVEESVKPKYNSLNEFDRLHTKAKGNAVIAVWIGLHSDPKNFFNKEKPNEFDHVKHASNYINSVKGFTNQNMNQHFLVDQMKMRNNNNNISVLKGQSIAADNLLSIAGVTQMQFIDAFAIPFKLKFSDFKGINGTDAHGKPIDKVKFITDTLNSIFGKREDGSSAFKIHVDGEYVTVWCKQLYNNDKGTWKDINGLTIAEQRTELTSNVLDAVKYNMAENTNTYTIGDLALMSSFPVSWNVNLHHDGASISEVNRFIYPMLIENQQIIVDLVTDIGIKSLSNPNNYTNISFHNVRSNYVVDALRTTMELMKEKGMDYEKVFDAYIKNHRSNKTCSNVISKLVADVKEEFKSYKESLKAHTRNINLTPRQISYAMQLLEYAEDTLGGINKYEYDAPIETRAKSVDELDKYLKEGVGFQDNITDATKYLDYLNRQLEILDYYEYCDKAVNAMKRAQGCLITEKKGAGPKITESNKIFENIAMMQYNMRTLKENAQRAGVPDMFLNDLEFEYFSVSDITKRGDVLDKHIDIFNEYLENRYNRTGEQYEPLTKPTCPFVIDGVSMIEAIFPSIVNDNWKIEDSAYPILQEQLYSTNELSTRMFGDIMLSEKPKFKDKINYIMSRLGQVNNPELREAIINYAIIDKARRLNFFTGAKLSPMQQLIQRSQLLGCIGLQDVNGEIVYKGDFDLSLVNIPLDNWTPYDATVSTPIEQHRAKVAAFKQLPVSIQLAMVKKTLQGKAKIETDVEGTVSTNKLNPNHILSLLNPTTMMPNVLKNGFMKIHCSESDDLDYTRSTFYQLINSTDEYLRILGENLVRYAFWVNKFDFGRNLSKYIPIDLFGEYRVNGEIISSYMTKFGDQFNLLNFESIDSTSHSDMLEYMRSIGIVNGDSEFRSSADGLQHYAKALYEAESTDDNILMREDNDNLLEFIEAFIRANSNNNRLVKKMKPEYDYTKPKVNGKSRIKDGTPSFIHMNRDILSRAITKDKTYGRKHEWHKGVDEEIIKFIEAELNKITTIYNTKDIWKTVGQIIIEPIEYVKNSNYANDFFLKDDMNFVPAEIKELGKTHASEVNKGTLYKRFEVNDCYVYYPINKTLPSEYMFTAVDYFKFGIEEESIYQKIGSFLSLFIKPNDTSAATVIKNDSVSEAISESTKDADAVIYIGDSNHTYRGLIDNSNVYELSVSELTDPKINPQLPSGKIKNLALIANGEPLSQLKQFTIQNGIFKGLERLNESLNPNNISAINIDGLNQVIVDYLGLKKNINSTVHTVKRSNVKFSTIIDTSFLEDNNTGRSVQSLSYMDALFEIEKTAIGNTKLLRDEMSILGDITTNLASLERKAGEQIDNLTTDPNLISRYIETLKYNSEVLDQVATMVDTVYNETNLSLDNILSLFKRGKHRTRKEWLTNINKLSSLIKSQNYIDRLEEMDITKFENASWDVKEAVDKFNNSLNLLKGKYRNFMPIMTEVNNAALNYFGVMLDQRSKNPYFKNKFKDLQDAIAERGFDLTDYNGRTITEWDIKENIRKMLNDNIDLTRTIALMDSAAQSGIPIVDTILAQYEFHVLTSEEWAYNTQNKVVEMFKGFDDYNLLNRKGKLIRDYQSSRAEHFKKKFIEPSTMQLNTPYNAATAEDDIRYQIAKIQTEYIEAIKALQPQLNSTNAEEVIVAKDKVSELKQERAYKISEIQKTYRRTIMLALPADGSNIDMEEALNNIGHLQLTDKEHLYYIYLIDAIRRSKLPRKFAEANGIEMDLKASKGKRFVYRINVYNATYKNAQFNNLSNEDIKLLAEMQKIFMELNDVAMPNTVRNGSFFPSFIQSSNADVVKQFFGWHDLEEDDYINTLAGETQYYLKATALNRPKIKGTKKINFVDMSEIDNYDSFIEKVNNNAKSKGYTKEIKTLYDVVDYNNYLKIEQIAKIDNRVNYDPVNVIFNYIHQLRTIRTRREFEPELLLLQSVLGMNEFHARKNSAKNKNVVNKILSSFTKKSEVVPESGKGTRIYTRYKEWFDSFEGKNRINSVADQIINVLHTANSKSLMWLNLTAAVKNIGTGHINIVSEAVGGEFTNQKALLKAHERYFKAIPALLASLGEHESDNLDVALIKLAGNIFEDQNEAGFDNKVSLATNVLSKWDNVMYFPNSGGEHYLQFTMFLSTLDTHRIVKGEIMNYEQYTRSIREKVFESILTDSQRDAYRQYVKDVETHRGNNQELFKNIEAFIFYKGNNFTKEQKKEFVTKYQEAMKQGRTEFEKYGTVRDAFELKNGMATIKENSGIDQEVFAKFLGKVKGVNHSLHGIYNTFDKSALSGMMFGEVLLQFRKWLRPNFIRHYGKRVGHIIFDERLEAYRSGAYTDFFSWLTSNISYAYKNTLKEAREKGEDTDFLLKSKAVIKAFAAISYMFKDLMFRYKIMPKQEQANIRRTTFNLCTLIGLSLLACILYNMKDDDDDLDNSTAFAMLTYAIYGVQTELYETSPGGIYSFYKRTTEAPIPFETTLGHWQDLLFYSTIAPLVLDEEDLVYDRGTYKGKSKLNVSLQKAVPVKSQFHKIWNLPKNDTYYMKQNPILQMITFLSKYSIRWT
ncbi:MAG: hypothetical protein HDQ88_04715 [Clostridia bacterium]|nr:hypothetical protein [Clostridia bacterium]